jgi:hypothetical protein
MGRRSVRLSTFSQRENGIQIYFMSDRSGQQIVILFYDGGKGYGESGSE